MTKGRGWMVSPAEDPIAARSSRPPRRFRARPHRRDASGRSEAARSRPAWSTVCAALLSAGLAVGFLVAGVRSVAVAGAGGMAAGDRAQLGSLGLGGGDGALLVAAGITSAVFIGVSVLVLVLDAGLLARRGWGREGLLGVHGVLALVVLPISVGGVFGGASRAWIGVLAGLVNAGVVVLLVLDATTDDMYRAALLRRGRRR